MRELKLEPKAREVIKQYIREHGEMTVEQIVAVLEPHYIYHPQTLKQRDMKRLANQIIASIRDESGVRSVYNYKENNDSIYVNVDVSEDPIAIREVEKQLTKKYQGLNQSTAKVRNRLVQVEGQMKLDLEAMQ